MRSNNTLNVIGLAGLLTIALIVLKLTGVIDWSWLWVLSPLWIVILAIVIVILAIIGIIITFIGYKKRKNI